MKIKSILLGTAIVLAASMGSVQAGEPFSTLTDVQVVKMTSDQMANVRGGDHVIRLIQFRAGQTPPTAAAVAATTAAGSKSGAMDRGNAQDRAKIVGMLP